MDEKRIKELRQIAYLDPDPLLTECLDEIERLRQVLKEAPSLMGCSGHPHTAYCTWHSGVRAAALHGEESDAESDRC